eukprot:scaffold2141_cov282-Pinguiococcus_pyrenoidosus.AAC.7
MATVAPSRHSSPFTWTLTGIRAPPSAVVEGSRCSSASAGARAWPTPPARGGEKKEKIRQRALPIGASGQKRSKSGEATTLPPESMASPSKLDLSASARTAITSIA